MDSSSQLSGLALHGPQSRILGTYTRRRERGEYRAARTVQEPQPKNEHFHKARRWLEYNRRHRCASPSSRLLLRPPPAVAYELLEVDVQRRVGIVQKRRTKRARLTARNHVLVHLAIVISQHGIEQAHGAIGFPAAVPHLT